MMGLWWRKESREVDCLTAVLHQCSINACLDYRSASVQVCQASRGITNCSLFLGRLIFLYSDDDEVWLLKDASMIEGSLLEKKVASLKSIVDEDRYARDSVIWTFSSYIET
ncbi:hypothetical protein ACOSQ3_023572 [Xanthoceras sorbifolium]